MTVRAGNPKSYSNAAVAVNGSAGVTLTLPASAHVLQSIVATYVATATAGNRVVYLKINNPSGKTIWVAPFTTSITAGQTALLVAGAAAVGSKITESSAFLGQWFPLPDNFSLEPGSLIFFADAGNVDVADTVQVNYSVSY